MSLVTLVALQLGPWAAWVVPSLAAVLGLALGVLGVFILRARAKQLDAAAQTRLSPADEGRRVTITGRLVADGDGVPSLIDGRPVALSVARGPMRSEERRGTSLALQTPDGLYPLAGTLELQGESARAADVAGLGSCNVMEARVGQTVLVDGFVGRVMQESLRDPAARLGLRSDRDGFFEPVRVRLRPSARRREALVLGGVLLATVLLLVPLPSSLHDGPTTADDETLGPVAIRLYGTAREPTTLRRLASIVRLLSPVRDAERASLEESRARRRRTAGAIAWLDDQPDEQAVPAALPARSLATLARRRVQAIRPQVEQARADAERLAEEARAAEALRRTKELSYRGFDPEGLLKHEGEAWAGRPPEPPDGRVVYRVCGLSGHRRRAELADRAAYVERQLALR